MANFVYVVSTPPEKLGRYINNLGTIEMAQAERLDSLRRNPGYDIPGGQKAALMVFINHARALGWKLPGKWNAWQPDTLPDELLALAGGPIEFLIGCQAKILAKIAPTTTCITADGAEITLPMQIYQKKNGDLVWTAVAGLRYAKQGKFVLDEFGNRVHLKMVQEGKYDKPECTVEWENYHAKDAKKAFAAWPMPFFPKGWAANAGPAAAELLDTWFNGDTITLVDDMPVDVMSEQAPLPSGDEIIADADASPDIGSTYETPTGDIVHELPLDYASDDKYDWQNLAIERWLEAGCRGMVEAATGAGKTIFCLKAISALQDKVKGPLDISIVVPTEALQAQWEKEILERTAFTADQVALQGGRASKGEKPAQVTIYVINSARNLLPKRHFPHDHLLIVDEAHRAKSSSNQKIFNSDYQYSLGVSATFPEDESDFGVLEDGLGKLLAVFRYAHALKKKTISDFKLVFMSARFTPEEKDEYNSLTSLAMAEGNDFWRKVKFGQRAWHLWNCSGRISCAMNLIQELSQANQKIIIFHKSTTGIQALYNVLSKLNFKVGIYHSKLKNVVRRNFLQAFKDGKINILLSAQALLEGLDVPDCDAAVCIAADKSSVKIIQSLGRVLRRKPSQPLKHYYCIIVREAKPDLTLKAKFLNTLRDTDGELIVPVENIQCSKLETAVDSKKFEQMAGFSYNKKTGKAEVAEPEFPDWALQKIKKKAQQIIAKPPVVYEPPVEEEVIPPPPKKETGPPPEPKGPPEQQKQVTIVEDYQELDTAAAPLSDKKYVFYLDADFQKPLLFLKKNVPTQAGTNSAHSAAKFMQAYAAKRGGQVYMMENL